MIIETETNLIVPPGETIKEQMKQKNISLKELAKAIDEDEERTQELLEGDIRMQRKHMEGLEQILGIPFRFWRNLEDNYRNELDEWEDEAWS
jgi:plasmid maintenance system antidote protein VapI